MELPSGVKLIGCKWIFKTKRDSQAKIKRYKARFVTKDITQKEDIDYKETLSNFVERLFQGNHGIDISL